MSIFVNADTRVCVQGITGRDGLFHTKAMVEYGTKVVAGVTPGKGGRDVEGIPVFNTVCEAVEKTRADASIVFVPARVRCGRRHGGGRRRRRAHRRRERGDPHHRRGARLPARAGERGRG